MARISSLPRKRRLLHGFAHRTRCRTTSLCMSAGQIIRQLAVRPPADTPCRIGSDVVGLPAVDYRTREFPAGTQPEQEIPRRVAFAAMAERLGEISAPIPFRRLARVRLDLCPGLNSTFQNHMR